MNETKITSVDMPFQEMVMLLLKFWFANLIAVLLLALPVAALTLLALVVADLLKFA